MDELLYSAIHTVPNNSSKINLVIQFMTLQVEVGDASQLQVLKCVIFDVRSYIFIYTMTSSWQRRFPYY